MLYPNYIGMSSLLVLIGWSGFECGQSDAMKLDVPLASRRITNLGHKPKEHVLIVVLSRNYSIVFWQQLF
jgi:hypothetical protein